MTVGLVIGSVLAQETPLGAAYFLDPKVIASFISWGVYVLLLFVRRSAGLRGRKAAYFVRRRPGRHDGRLGRQPLQPCSQVRSAMTLALIGVNHKTAPIELRERIAISREGLPETTRALAGMPGVIECMIVSTCNRVELLAAVESPDIDLTGFLHSYFGLDPALLAPHIYEHRDQEAVRHLFRMAASLDSMVVGEPQILGQVKEAFAVAKASGTVAGQLEHLLQSAFAAAKKARSETGIGSNSRLYRLGRR